MSIFIDKLNQLSRAEPQPMGFRTKQSVSPKPKIQLVASLAQKNASQLVDSVTGVDAGLLRISKPGSGAESLQNMSQAISDIPWGGWLQDSAQEEIEQLLKANCDFVVFSATSTPLAIFQNDEVGKILEIEASINEGLLRTVNGLPIDAVLIAIEQREDYILTWQHLMLFQRFANLLIKPLLVPTPPNLTSDELLALWEAGVDGMVIEVRIGQPQDRLTELRQIIDKLTFPLPRKREKMEPLIPRTSQESGIAVTEEEEEEE